MRQSPYSMPVVEDDQILALETRVQQAQKRRSLDGLNVFGFGEVSIALGWPIDAPDFVAKRLIPMPTAAAIDGPLAAIDAFTAKVRNRGANVLPYETRRVQRGDGQYVGYVLQPIVPGDQLAEKVLERDEPTAFHPLLIAVREFVMACSDELTPIDAQVPNFAWRDGELHLLDITSPSSFEPDGTFVDPLSDLSKRLVPAPLRPVLNKASADILGMYRGPQGALTQVVVFLHRIGAQAWVGPAIETFNEALDEPIDPATVNARWERNVKEFPRLKKLLQLQRAWQENVRRTPYEYLITDSFTGQVI